MVTFLCTKLSWVLQQTLPDTVTFKAWGATGHSHRVLTPFSHLYVVVPPHKYAFYSRSL